MLCCRNGYDGLLFYNNNIPHVLFGCQEATGDKECMITPRQPPEYNEIQNNSFLLSTIVQLITNNNTY